MPLEWKWARELFFFFLFNHLKKQILCVRFYGIYDTREARKPEFELSRMDSPQVTQAV